MHIRSAMTMTVTLNERRVGTSRLSESRIRKEAPSSLKEGVPEVVYGGAIVETSMSHSASDSVPLEDTLLYSSEEISYSELLRKNKPFRLFLLSYIANHTGEWMTYLASISAIEEIQRANGLKTSHTAIGALIVVRLMPNVLLSPFGGVLADGWDRRKSMIALDLAGAVIAWFFILAVHQKSVPMIYISTFFQECVAGLYEPCRSAIIPQLAPEEDHMKKATTLTGVAWSVIAALGSAAGGFFVSLLGIRECYMIDCATYLISAQLMAQIGGKWDVTKRKSKGPDGARPSCGMLAQAVYYLRFSFFGWLVVLKAASALIYGAYDVLNVSFAEMGGEDGRATRLGIIFATVGVGSIIGPMISDRYTNMNDPSLIQQSCLYGFLVMAIGSVMMGAFSSFWMVCFSSAFRSMGASVIWINSSILLQKFCVPEMLGRVSGLEYSIALLAEALSAAAAGMVEDEYDMSANDITIVLGVLGIALLALWTCYDVQGGGAASYREECGESTCTVITENSSETPQSIEIVPLVSAGEELLLKV